MYYTADRQTYTVIDEFTTLTAARKAVKKYLKEDKGLAKSKLAEYDPEFYVILDKEKKEVKNMKKIMYASVIDGKFDMTWEDVIIQVKDNPIFNRPNNVAIIGNDGTEYTGNDLLKAAGVKNDCPEECIK